MCAAFVALVVAAPTAAHAAEPVCQPSEDVAALDQYCDSLPAPDGQEQPVRFDAAPVRMPISRALPARKVEKLRESGPEARALLVLPVVAPVRARPEQRERIRATKERVLRSTGLDAPGVTPEAVVSGVSTVGPRVVGGAFRWVLLVCTLGFAGMAWLRFRTRLKL